MTSDSKKPRSPLVQQLRHDTEQEDLQKAWRDILAGWQRRELWTTLGLHDVRQRYRRSTLGPFWITISMGVMVFTMPCKAAASASQGSRDFQVSKEA
jgi:ABC-2 type transport system permease protein/lipopolysaccharide transport system permease protein